MLERKALKDLLPRSDLARLDKLLLALACDQCAPKRVKDVVGISSQFGLPKASKWNVSDILGKSNGLSVKTAGGWELTGAGKARVSEILGQPPPPQSSELRQCLAKIQDPDAKAFVEEAIQCYEHKLFRAAVVLTWVGALYLLYREVVTNHLAVFNAEATKRNANWKPAKNEDGLARMKEHDFLDILEPLSVIGKSVKDELQNCLKLRNGCGHPNSLKIGQQRVAAHIETLILNVFSRFA